ncbi:hypothetical protein [Rhodoferax sp.]|uniref:hypothetical protein n=1 Tax=Rhodoferax sp. TaxID=50421 RepID=UPI00277AD4A3|nr:hypothetical protein [Rhodoferax sp.]
MDLLELLNHLLNFLAPALAVAALVAVVARVSMRNRPVSLSLWTQIATNFIACGLALGIGLWFFGRDGKMASLAAMVLCCATCQWVMHKGWRA